MEFRKISEEFPGACGSILACMLVGQLQVTLPMCPGRVHRAKTTEPLGHLSNSTQRPTLATTEQGGCGPSAWPILLEGLSTCVLTSWVSDRRPSTMNPACFSPGSLQVVKLMNMPRSLSRVVSAHGGLVLLVSGCAPSGGAWPGIK